MQANHVHPHKTLCIVLKATRLIALYRRNVCRGADILCYCINAVKFYVCFGMEAEISELNQPLKILNEVYPKYKYSTMSSFFTITFQTETLLSGVDKKHK